MAVLIVIHHVSIILYINHELVQVNAMVVSTIEYANKVLIHFTVNVMFYSSI